MKILHTLAPADIGGLEEVVIRLTSGLRKRGHEVEAAVVLPGDAPRHPVEEALERVGIPVHGLRIPGRGYAREIREIRALLGKGAFEILHTHGYRPDVLHARAARSLGLPVVSTFHGFTGGDLRNRMYEWLQRRAARRMAAVVAVSRPMAAFLRETGVPPERLHVIANAWSPRHEALDRPAARARLGVPEGRFLVGWVGRLSSEKDPALLLDALEALGDEAGLQAVLLGDGPLRTTLERRVKAPAAVPVRLLGAVPGAAALFRGFDLLVLSSRTEGTPIVLLEAAAAGVPIVATAVGGVPAAFDEGCARLVPWGDATALAGAIRDVRTHPAAARERALRARRRLEEAFAPEPWLDRYESLYASLLHEHPAPR